MLQQEQDLLFEEWKCPTGPDDGGGSAGEQMIEGTPLCLYAGQRKTHLLEGVCAV